MNPHCQYVLTGCSSLFLQSHHGDIDSINQLAQNLIRQADSRNRTVIEKENLALNQLWTDLVGDLENRLESFTNIADLWRELENKFHSLEKSATRLEERARHVDLVVRSRRQLEETKNAIQVQFLEFCKDFIPRQISS